MGFRVVTIVILFFVMGHISPAQKRTSRNFPAFVYGTWRIHKLKGVAGHGRETPDLAQKEIGQKIRFGRKAIRFDKGLLFLEAPCRRVSYAFRVHKFANYEVGEPITLDFFGLNPAKERVVQNVVVRCNGRPQYLFELTNDNQLAIYYDGWFFYLERVTK